MERFGDIAVKIDGSVPTDKRNDIVHQFQENPETRLFVGNIKAAGEGITLTAACNVAFLEFPWTPGDLMQAEDRAHRIGQTQCVNVWYLVPKNTIAEHMAEILSDKTKTLSAIIDGEGNNAESDMLSGDFSFAFRVTTTPLARSLKAIVSWTADGFTTYYEDLV